MPRHTHYNTGRNGVNWELLIGVASTILLIRKDLLYPSNLAVFQPHFDPARMEWGGCKDILHDPNCPFAGSLVLFENNFDALSGSNVAALLTVHCALSFAAAGCLWTRESFSFSLLWRNLDFMSLSRRRRRQGTFEIVLPILK
jgi:hypothetical protein